MNGLIVNSDNQEGPQTNNGGTTWTVRGGSVGVGGCNSMVEHLPSKQASKHKGPGLGVSSEKRTTKRQNNKKKWLSDSEL